MEKYPFQMIYKPIISLYMQIQDNLLQCAEELVTKARVEPIKEERHILIDKILEDNKKIMAAVRNLSKLTQDKEEKNKNFPEYYKTTEALLIIIKLLYNLKNSKYADEKIEKELEHVIFLFFSYTLKLCDKIYATYTVKSADNEKSN